MRHPPRDPIDIAGERPRRDAPEEAAVPEPAGVADSDSSGADVTCPIPAPALAAVAEILCYLFRIDREDGRTDVEGQSE